MKYSAELIGNIIKTERNKRNWSQKQLGDKLNITGKQVSKYEHGDPIPPMDILLKLCDVFECEFGYILGEKQYSKGSRLQTAIHDELNLSVESTIAIKMITGTSRRSLSFGNESEKYTRILNNLLSSPLFPCFIEAVGILDDYTIKKKTIFSVLKEKYGEDIFEQAWNIHFSSVDYEHNDELFLSAELCEAIKEIRAAEDDSCDLSYNVKVARYELKEILDELILDLYPRR